MKKSKIITLAILIIMFVSLSIYLYKSNHNPVVLDEVILKQEIPNDSFAMYKESDEGYTEVEGTKFPEGYVLNINESKCIDNNGNEINNALSYENDKVVLTTNKTVYCYLYFDKSLGLEIKEKKPNKLSEDIKGEMYRFQGQQNDNVNNYICFGTSDKSACTQEKNKYMYRIIGIEAETGRVKVIKMEALDQSVQWYTDYDHDIKFPQSKIYETISGSGFLTNKEYVPEGWENKISDNTWIYGDMWENSDIGAKQLGAGLYETESGKKSTSWYVKSTQEEGGSPYEVQWEGNTQYYKQTLYYKEESGKWEGEEHKVTSKISLMYLHDYSYSVGDEAKCNYYHEESEYSKCKKGWMHLSNNDTNTPPSVHEWTMSRTGWLMWSGAFNGFSVNGAGCTASTLLSSSLSVRPVFYLASVNQLLGGSGTSEDPFMLN